MKGNLYLITNNINDKVYVGKTYSSIDKRFKQHIQESRRDRSIGRDLYDAMRKFGIENFNIQLLGVFEEGVLEEKEIEYIAKYDSYKNGYNQTLGGDGKRYSKFTDEEAIKTYKKYNNLSKASKELQCDKCTLRTILTKNGVKITSSKEILSKPIINSEGVEFDSIGDASRYLIETGKANGTHKHVVNSIIRVLKGERKSYLKMSWTYLQ